MRKIATLFACITVALLLAAPASAKVAVSASVLWSPNPDRDVEVFLHASNVAYPAPRDEAVVVFSQLHDPGQDYPVVAFIAHIGRVSLETVWSYRLRGHSWGDTMLHFGVRTDSLMFVTAHPPGPPYGKAYGHWKKDRRMRANALSDDDIRFWVDVRTAAVYTGMTPDQVLRSGHGPRDLRNMTAKHYRKHKKDRPEMQKAGFGNGPGKGRGRKNKH